MELAANDGRKQATLRRDPAIWRALARTMLVFSGALALLALSGPAWAQTSGQLRVILIGIDELPISDVGVSLSGETLIGGTQQKRSDAEGAILFRELPPGLYRLHVPQAGVWGAVTVEEILINPNRTTTQIVRLQPAPEGDVIVQAKGGAIDTSSTTTGQVLTKDFLHRIPAGRTYQTAVQSVPGPSGAAAGNPSMAGGSSNESTYMIDGAPPAPVASSPAPIARTVAPLRAGVTDDNADFAAYLEFLASWSDRSDMVSRYAWMEVRGKSRITVLDASGAPVPHAKIEIFGEGRSWESSALGDGSSAFYPRMMLNTAPKTVRASLGGASVHARWDGSQDLVLRLDVGSQPVEAVPLDVMLLIDTTGSMDDEIERIKSTLLSVTREVLQLQRPVDLRWGAVLYRDQGDEYLVKHIPFTASVETFQEQIRLVAAGGGGDTPEALSEGLHAAVSREDWRDKAAKVGFLIADAPPQMQREVSYADAALTAVSRGIRFHSVAASGLDNTGSLVFRQIAQVTGGKFIFIEYGSIAQSAADHGVTGAVSSNNLDAILAGQLREEVTQYGIGAKVASR